MRFGGCILGEDRWHPTIGDMTTGLDDVWPGALWVPIPEDETQPPIWPTQIINHTAVDGARTTGLAPWWNSAGNNLESTGYVAQDGTFQQYVRCTVKADANNRANRRWDGRWVGAISIETWDGRGSGLPESPWNDRQLDTLIAFHDWACRTYGIPREICPTWDAPGIGWHNLHREWSPGPTGCPGAMRAAQVRDVIVPELKALATRNAASTTPGGSSLMAPRALITVNDVGVEFVATTPAYGSLACRWQQGADGSPAAGGAYGQWVFLGGAGPVPIAIDSVIARAAIHPPTGLECAEVEIWHSSNLNAVYRSWQTEPGGLWAPWQAA